MGPDLLQSLLVHAMRLFPSKVLDSSPTYRFAIQRECAAVGSVVLRSSAGLVLSVSVPSATAVNPEFRLRYDAAGVDQDADFHSTVSVSDAADQY
jgi:hypothetical protein